MRELNQQDLAQVSGGVFLFVPWALAALYPPLIVSFGAGFFNTLQDRPKF